MIFPAISIMQPWPYAMFNLGKDCENRSWALPIQYFNKTVLIHAGKKMDKAGLDYLDRFTVRGGRLTPREIPLGGIVGRIEFSACSRMYLSDWGEPGFFHWFIRAAAPLKFHPCKGSLGFFEVDYPYEIPE
jgi:hypothetical protein